MKKRYVAKKIKVVEAVVVGINTFDGVVEERAVTVPLNGNKVSDVKLMLFDKLSSDSYKPAYLKESVVREQNYRMTIDTFVQKAEMVDICDNPAIGGC